jgi:hypothetical protein
MRRAGTLLLFAVIGLASNSCAFLLRSSCENTVKSEVKSPDGKYIVTLFERNCGATTDFSTIVSLRENSTELKADDLGIFVVKGQPKIDLAWEGNTRLRLQCQLCRADEIFKQEGSWKEIEIFFVH